MNFKKGSQLKSFFELLEKSKISKEELKDGIEKTIEDLRVITELQILENEFIEIHNAVFSHPMLQDKINKSLSMEYAEKQANNINSIKENDNDVKYYINLTPMYQMGKMRAGSTGQVAIGIYAKAITFNSLAQQLNKKGKPLYFSFKKETKGPNKDKPIKVESIFGNMKIEESFGKKTEENTDPRLSFLQRTISERLDEIFNTATDNEKAQILGRTGLDHIASISVHSYMNLIGLGAERVFISSVKNPSDVETHVNKNRDKYLKYKDNPFLKNTIDPETGETVYYLEYDYPYLFLSQPIIKDYLEEVESDRAIVRDYDKFPKSPLEIARLYSKNENIAGFVIGTVLNKQ